VNYRGVEVDLRENRFEHRAGDYVVRSKGIIFWAQSKFGEVYARTAELAFKSMCELIDQRLVATPG
jgi:hypothetical protein